MQHKRYTRCMNLKVLTVLLIGIFAMAALFVYPPWRAHDVYAGHHRVDRVRWMEPDNQRLFIELGMIAVVTGLLAFKLWGKNKGNNE